LHKICDAGNLYQSWPGYLGILYINANLLGWLVNMKTFIELYNYVVESGEMNFLLTFKLSQDPLENFFSSFPMSSGFCNNPTSIQFKAAFQSLR
jgi:hypothetical protein